MRRSAAPSQAGTVPKRPRFTPPFQSSPTSNCVNVKRNVIIKTLSAGAVVANEDYKISECILETDPVTVSVPKRTTKSVLQLLTKTVSNNESIISLHETSPLSTAEELPVSSLPDEKENSANYFSVVWCKNSAKKHKKWEGDAVLIVQGRTVIIKDMEGKDIGRASGYKTSELSGLDDGSTLTVGGKIIEIMGTISTDSYNRGLCFQMGSTAPASVEVKMANTPTEMTKKIFQNPLKNEKKVTGLSKKVTILFDPTRAGALVMPRPDPKQRWQNSETIVDVVVDPHISCTLRPHQMEGVVFLYECVMGFRNFQGQGCILADEMGLGKTLQCITLIWTLYKQGPYAAKPVIKHILIITPSSLVRNWEKEFNKWLGKERIKIYCVDQNSKPSEFKNCPFLPVIIISYEMFVKYSTEMLSIKFELIICDEGHRLKNITSKTSLLLSQLDCNQRILLTGTPIQNDLKEFHAIVDFVNPGLLGNPASFRRIYEDPIVAGQQSTATEEERELGQSRADELNHLIGLFMLRRTQEIINKYLPPKVETVLFCSPSTLQCHLYHHLIGSKYVRECISLCGDGMLHLGLIMALKKVSNHPSLVHRSTQSNDVSKDEVSVYSELTKVFPDGYTADEYLEEHSGKLFVVSSLLWHLKNNTKEKIVLVSHYTQTLNMLASLCDRNGYKYLRLDGSTPSIQRQSLVDRFNFPNTQEFIFLLSCKAGGVGLNLIGASRILMYDTDWNPANDLQAMARVWRDGQNKIVYIYRLLTTGTIDEKIYLRQIMKQGLTGAVVDSKDSTKIRFSREELKDLFHLHQDTPCLTHDLLNCKCLQDIVHEDDNIEEIDSRSCQLGSTSNSNQLKNLTMNELLQWKHFPKERLEEILQDIGMRTAEENISFAFQNTSNFNKIT